MSTETKTMKLPFIEKFGYGLGDTASNFVWALMMNFIMFYYTDIFGITAAAAGTMLLFARSTDGVVDFFIGAMADRTNQSGGASVRISSGCECRWRRCLSSRSRRRTSARREKSSGRGSLTI